MSLQAELFFCSTRSEGTQRIDPEISCRASLVGRNRNLKSPYGQIWGQTLPNSMEFDRSLASLSIEHLLTGTSKA